MLEYGRSSNKRQTLAIRWQILVKAKRLLLRSPQTDLASGLRIYIAWVLNDPVKQTLERSGLSFDRTRAQSASVNFELIPFFGFYEIFPVKE